MGLSPDQITIGESEGPLRIEEHSPEFSPGQIVMLRSDPSVKGAVVELLPGQPEDRVKVFVGGTIQSYYSSQLKAEAPRDETQFLSLDQFHAYLTALQIRHPACRRCIRSTRRALTLYPISSGLSCASFGQIARGC